jgi:hypothetical protein
MIEETPVNPVDDGSSLHCSGPAGLKAQRDRGSGPSISCRITKPVQPQTAVPTKAPMPAVSAIAKAPQNVTRAVALRTFAPPALAPIAPRRPRKPKDAAETIGTSIVAGATTTISNGIAAPTANVAADVRAACTGRAVDTSDIRRHAHELPRPCHWL